MPEMKSAVIDSKYIPFHTAKLCFQHMIAHHSGNVDTTFCVAGLWQDAPQPRSCVILHLQLKEVRTVKTQLIFA
jgi:hypothetical protein